VGDRSYRVCRIVGRSDGKWVPLRITHNCISDDIHRTCSFRSSLIVEKLSDDSDENQTIYARIGGNEAVESVVADFYDRVFSDPLLQPYFEDIDRDALYAHQVQFISAVAGGPVSYDGADMQAAHEEWESPGKPSVALRHTSPKRSKRTVSPRTTSTRSSMKSVRQAGRRRPVNARKSREVLLRSFFNNSLLDAIHVTATTALIDDAGLCVRVVVVDRRLEYSSSAVVRMRDEVDVVVGFRPIDRRKCVLDQRLAIVSVPFLFEVRGPRRIVLLVETTGCRLVGFEAAAVRSRSDCWSRVNMSVRMRRTRLRVSANMFATSRLLESQVGVTGAVPTTSRSSRIAETDALRISACAGVKFDRISGRSSTNSRTIVRSTRWSVSLHVDFAIPNVFGDLGQHYRCVVRRNNRVRPPRTTPLAAAR